MDQRTEANSGRSSALQRFLEAQWHFLTFRSSPVAEADHNPFLTCAMGITWIAGIGRYWDHPDPLWWQSAGLGSVVYSFVFAAMLWIVGLPMRIRGWSYAGMLLFVCMTSAPALLYAIPVERFLAPSAAADVNFWFLFVVALWRLLLLMRFFALPCELGGGGVVVTLLPVSLIVIGLVAFGLHQQTFAIMAHADAERAPHAGATDAVQSMVWASAIAAVPLLVAYFVMAWDRQIGGDSNAARGEGTVQ